MDGTVRNSLSRVLPAIKQHTKEIFLRGEEVITLHLNKRLSVRLLNSYHTQALAYRRHGIFRKLYGIE